MHPFQEIDNSPSPIDVTLCLSKRFKNIFELAYALTDLHSVLSTFYFVGSNRLEKPMLPTTVRTFTKSYEDTLTLKDFHSGSFCADIATTVFGGLVLMFLERLFNHKPQSITVNIKSITVNVQDPAQREHINEIMEKTLIVPGDVEASVRNFVSELRGSDICDIDESGYDPNGVRVLAKSIERLGRSIDVRA